MVLNENFKIVQLDVNPTCSIHIGVELPVMVKKRLIECLQYNGDLFAVSPGEMP